MPHKQRPFCWLRLARSEGFILELVLISSGRDVRPVEYVGEMALGDLGASHVDGVAGVLHLQEGERLKTEIFFTVCCLRSSVAEPVLF